MELSSDIHVLFVPATLCAAVLIVGLCASIFNPPDRYYWQTPKHVKIGILKPFIDLYVHPSCTQIKDGSQFDVMFIGRGFFPFFGAVWAVLFDYGSIESAIFILAWCAVPYLNIFAHDGLLSIFCRYIFYAITQLTIGTGYFLIPFVLSYYKSSYVAFSWLLIITPIMFIVNTLINMYFRRYTENKFGFDESTVLSLKRYSLSLWDYWCLKKIRVASQCNMSFIDFVAQYKDEVESEEEKSYITKIRLEQSLTQRSHKSVPPTSNINDAAPKTPPIENKHELASNTDSEKKHSDNSGKNVIENTASSEHSDENTTISKRSDISVTTSMQSRTNGANSDRSRLAELEEELQKIPVAKVKRWHAEGRITDEQFRTIAKRYNQLKKERNEIQERLSLLEYIDKKESE